ncbi:MAG: hypothetical protein O7G85_03745, partial [Planctomycetota bacterium]|nr:hypothetical protein [Planctomycetota bacterium]
MNTHVGLIIIIYGLKRPISIFWSGRNVIGMQIYSASFGDDQTAECLPRIPRPFGTHDLHLSLTVLG